MQFLTLAPDSFRYGVAEPVLPSVRRVMAENPSKFTYRGTGTYIVGHGDVVVIDPGPELDSHRDALAAALAGERVRAILALDKRLMAQSIEARAQIADEINVAGRGSCQSCRYGGLLRLRATRDARQATRDRQRHVRRRYRSQGSPPWPPHRTHWREPPPTHGFSVGPQRHPERPRS